MYARTVHVHVCACVWEMCAHISNTLLLIAFESCRDIYDNRVEMF